MRFKYATLSIINDIRSLAISIMVAVSIVTAENTNAMAARILYTYVGLWVCSEGHLNMVTGLNAWVEFLSSHKSSILLDLWAHWGFSFLSIQIMRREITCSAERVILTEEV
jgi:hypothetical protein